MESRNNLQNVKVFFMGYILLFSDLIYSLMRLFWVGGRSGKAHKKDRSDQSLRSFCLHSRAKFFQDRALFRRPAASRVNPPTANSASAAGSGTGMVLSLMLVTKVVGFIAVLGLIVRAIVLITVN